MVMRGARLSESGPLFGGSPARSCQAAGGLEHSIDTRRAHGHDVGIEHHVRQPAITFVGPLLMKIENGLPLVRFEPMVSRNESVVLVDMAEAFLPVMKLARRDADPG